MNQEIQKQQAPHLDIIIDELQIVHNYLGSQIEEYYKLISSMKDITIETQPLPESGLGKINQLYCICDKFKILVNIINQINEKAKTII